MKFFVILTIFLVQKLLCFELARQNLTQTLFADYDKTIIPKSSFQIRFTFSLRQILSINEKEQTMISNTFFYERWKDERLTWNISSGSQYENIIMITVPAMNIWTPDCFILNTVDSNGFFQIDANQLASVSHTGEVIINFPLTSLKTRCDIETRLFPFDTQVCLIALTSWAYQSSQLKFNVKDALETKYYKENSIWSLVGVDYRMKEDDSRWSLEKFVFKTNASIIVTEIEISLKRKPLYVMVNGVFPCLVLNIVTLVAYFLASDTQINLCMTCFLTFSVNLIVISSEIPVQSDYLPLISIYFIFSIIHSLVSIVWFSFMANVEKQGELPVFYKWLSSKISKNKVSPSDSDKQFKHELIILNRIVFIIVLIVTILSIIFIWLGVLF
jgi:hypothetical protein